MSWIFGFCGASLSPALRERLAALHAPPLQRWEDDAHYLALGGLPETCRFGVLPDGGAWAVVGLGIQRGDDHCAFLNAADWQTLLARPTPDLDDLDGHFVAVRRRAGRLEGFTDGPGVRTLYLTTLPEGTAVSTRLDWLAALRGGVEIDLAAFGSHWRSFCQLASTSLVEGVRRLGPGGRLVCSGTNVEATERPWTPDVNEEDRDGVGFTRTLAALLHPQPTDGRALSLGLSGGLDSRLLLAMRMDDPPVRTHVFGPADHPDAQIANRIAEREGLHHQRLHTPVPDADGCLALLRSHVAHTQVVSPASSVIGLRYYPALHARRLILIDGAMGEVARRQFMNRLLLLNRQALRAGDLDAILAALHAPRVDVFNEDATATMARGARQQIEAVWQALPAPSVIGEENVLDMLRVRTVLPNLYGFEHNRLDGVIQNYMPFAQPSLLRAVFRVPLALRRNGRLVRRIIRSRHPSLARYPLVKSDVPYPFRLPPLPAYLWKKVTTFGGRRYTDPVRLRFLETLKPYVLDTVRSEPVRTYAAYDHVRLTRLVKAFYAGRHELSLQVDWWLAFETWRCGLRNG